MVAAALANSAWFLSSAPAFAAFNLALQDPQREQETILRRFLRANAQTAFGREHGFSDIRTPEQFSQRVPPRDYDDFRPWIDRIQRGEANVLTTQPVRRLIPTSGSTAARKLIPYTASMQRQLNRAIGPWIFDLYRRHPQALLGPSYWSISPLAEDTPAPAQASAVPIGFDDDAAYLGGWREWAINAAMAVPSQLKTLGSISLWRYLTLLLLLRRRDLTLISIWHPSFLELLLETLKDRWRALVSDVSSGKCAIWPDLPELLRRTAIASPDARRADELQRAGTHRPATIWPNLRIISCWAGGHAAHSSASLAARFPGVLIQPKGLLATEGVVSIPLGDLHPLAIRSHYLEFEDDTGRIHGAGELRQDHAYRVLLTTAGGLCRYRLHDLVRVNGRVGRTPSVRFVGKAALISDRMGEKLSEGFVALVLAQLFARHDLKPEFALLAPDVEDGQTRYTLYVRATAPAYFAAALDAALSENPHYAYCRQLGQLYPPRIFQLMGNPYAAYTLRLQQLGQRLGDIKPASLSNLSEWSSYFTGKCQPATSTWPAESALHPSAR
jgi:hypothetical protein